MANSFTHETNIQGLWNFESGALTTDGSGNGNTLTTIGTPAEDTVNYKQGSCSVDLEQSEGDGYSRADADLSSNFPLKSGDTSKLMSICLWFKPESLPGAVNYVLISKWDTNLISFMLQEYNSRLYFNWGTGTSYQTLTQLINVNLTAGRWYFIAIVLDGANKTFYSYLRDDTTGTEYTTTQTPNSVMSATTATLGIGCSHSSGSPGSYFDGLIDEVCVFNRLLNSQEIHAIRLGLFDEYVAMTQIFVEVEYDETPQVRMFQEFVEIEYSEYEGIEVYQNIVQVEYRQTPGIEVYQVLAQVEYDPNIKPLVVSGSHMESATEISEPVLTLASGKQSNFFLVFH